MVTFDQFVETCVAELVDEANPAESIIGQLNALKAKYEKSPIWKNKALEQIFAHYDHSIKSEVEHTGKQMVYYDFKEEFKRLDKYLNTLKSKNRIERNRLQKKVKDIQTRIKKDLRKIDRLDQSEISIDDLDKEDSDHMKKYKYEQRVKRLSQKLLRLQGAKESARLLDKVYKYTGTSYPELNDAISIKYRAIMQKKYKGKMPQRPMNSTPNISDINEIIDNVCTEKGITIPNKSDLAFQIASDIIKEVQRRREIELFEMMDDYEHDSHLRPTSVPDFADEELNRNLVNNAGKARDVYTKKCDEILAKFDKIDKDIGSGTIEGEGTASEDDDDDDDEDDTMADDNDDDEDEDISEDEAIDEDAEGAPDDDEDDDPILLDEAAQNNEASGSSIGSKKRSIESNGTETNGTEAPKKVKLTESQVTDESNATGKQETKEAPANSEQKKVEMKETDKKQIPEAVPEESPESVKADEDQSGTKINEPKKESKKEGDSTEVPPESTIETKKSDADLKQPPPTPSSSVVKSPSKPKSDGDKVDSNVPISKSEADFIKIVDLEEENAKGIDDADGDEDDDDDVICLD